MNRYEEAHHTVTVEAHVSEPWLAGAAFDAIRQWARASGLADIENFGCTMRVTFSGRTHGKALEEFDARLEATFSADIREHKVRELRDLKAPE